MQKGVACSTGMSVRPPVAYHPAINGHPNNDKKKKRVGRGWWSLMTGTPNNRWVCVCSGGFLIELVENVVSLFSPLLFSLFFFFFFDGFHPFFFLACTAACQRIWRRWQRRRRQRRQQRPIVDQSRDTSPGTWHTFLFWARTFRYLVVEDDEREKERKRRLQHKIIYDLKKKKRKFFFEKK